MLWKTTSKTCFKLCNGFATLYRGRRGFLNIIFKIPIIPGRNNSHNSHKGNQFLIFFSDITASESNFYISRKHIFQRILYFGQWTLIFCLVETVCYYSELFLLLETITVGTYLKRKTLPSSWNHLLWFSFQKKQRLLPVKAFLLSSGNVFLNESFIPAIGEGLSLSCGNRLCDKFFLLAESVTDMSGNQFLKTNLILATENRFSGLWKPFSSIASDIFLRVLHPG